MSKTLIIGGGVIGLTSAYFLAKQGRDVTVADQSEIGKEASWAGAGMLPPGILNGPAALREISRLSSATWAQLSAELLDLTGIDNGYRNCGSIQISLNSPEDLFEDSRRWKQADVPVVDLTRDAISELENEISGTIYDAFQLPTMSQVRNPRHLKALKNACERYGVKFLENSKVSNFSIVDGLISSVSLGNTQVEAETFVVTTGAWTSELLKKINLQFDVIPIRGQIALMKIPRPIFTHIIEDGPRYLVPREDGHILIGSTEDNVGFEKQTTSTGIQGLINFATQVVPKLTDAEVVKTWSGLRPKAVRGYPYIGKCADIENLTVAAGHFRDGLMQSPYSAQLIAELANNQTSSINLDPLNVISSTTKD